VTFLRIEDVNVYVLTTGYLDDLCIRSVHATSDSVQSTLAERGWHPDNCETHEVEFADASSFVLSRLHVAGDLLSQAIARLEALVSNDGMDFKVGRMGGCCNFCGWESFDPAEHAKSCAWVDAKAFLSSLDSQGPDAGRKQ
jgi:hypothetical protein